MKTTNPTTYLGLDLSLSATGYCVIGDGKVVTAGEVNTKPTDKEPRSEDRRLREIVEAVEHLMYLHGPFEAVAVEGLSFMSKGGQQHTRAGLHYMVRAGLLKRGENYLIVPPTTLKKFVTGKGNAKKEQMLLHVYKKWGFEAKTDNIGDAFSLARYAESLSEKR